MDRFNKLTRNKPLLVLCLLLSVLFLVWLFYGLATRDVWHEESCQLQGYEVSCADILYDPCYLTELQWANASECVVRGNTENIGKWGDYGQSRLLTYFTLVYQRLTTKPAVCWVRTCGAEFSRYKPLDAHGAISAVIFTLLILMMGVICVIYVYLLLKRYEP